MTASSPVVIASGNPGKVREMATILAASGLRALSLKDATFAGRDPIDFPEEGTAYEANAVAKVRAVVDQWGLPALGDDSGLEVTALDGRPGALSARYGGPDLDDRGRVDRLLSELGDTPESARGARFVCWAAFAHPGGPVETALGTCEGSILRTVQGEGGFGYDPIFRPMGHTVSMAELPPAEKDALSHRGRALRALVDRVRRALEASA